MLLKGLPPIKLKWVWVIFILNHIFGSRFKLRGGGEGGGGLTIKEAQFSEGHGGAKFSDGARFSRANMLFL